MRTITRILATLVIATFAVGPVSAATNANAVSAVAQSAPAAEAAATMSGVVTDASGKAISGVEILVSGPVRKTATTDATGAFSISVPPGLYTIIAIHAGYDTASLSDLALASGQKVTGLNVSLVASSLTSLRTIGTVRTSANRSTFNTSALSVSTMDANQIVSRVQPTLTTLVGELPGVYTGENSGGRSPNSGWSVRGAKPEALVTIDGHGISSGTSGSYLNIFANSEIFQQVEVVKGAGINGVDAGYSAFGTVNLRTRDFTPKDGVSATLDGSNYSGLHYFVDAQHSWGKFTVLAARSYQAYNGPDQGVPGPVANTSFPSNALNPSSQTPFYAGPALVKWQQDLSHPFTSAADLLKFRYKLSPATSVTLEYVNFVGRFLQQGASYAYNYGSFPIAQCFNGATPVLAGAAGCTNQSSYGNPQQANYIGQTIPLYSYFPNSYINDQEPQYNLEFKTQYKNDTFFVRPYETEIRRYIDGTTENQLPGNNGAFYQVTNVANCKIVPNNAAGGYNSSGILTPTVANGGAVGPCLSSANNFTSAYINNAGASVVPWFPTTSTAPTCSIAAPCYTTPLAQQGNGLWGYGSPFSQPEYDKLGGVTFSWLHPVGENLYSLNADYSSDYTTSATGDITALPAGCMPVVSGGSGSLKNSPFLSDGKTPNPYYQPNCAIGGQVLPFLPANNVQIPPTWNRKMEISLTGLWQINEKLQVGLGNYFTIQNLTYQGTNPAAANAAALLCASNPTAPTVALTCNVPGATGISLAGAEPALATLQMGKLQSTHYDPHFQLAYRFDRDTSLRASAGSSVTLPYATLVSGFGAISLNSGANYDRIQLPNNSLLPETTVAYDLGVDHRQRDGAVLSVDAFDNNIHNVFVNVNNLTNPLPGRPANITGLLQVTPTNGADMLDFGLEATIQKNPRRGMGYYASVTMQRAFYYGFGNAFYQSIYNAQTGNGVNPGAASFQAVVNGKQLDGTGGFEDQIPYTKGKFELNYAFPKANAAIGFVYNGNNNPWAIPAFATSYANARFDMGRGLSLGVAAENLLNYSSGTHTGQVINGAGFAPIGVKWSPGCSCLINGSPFPSTPFNSAVVVQPLAVHLSLTKTFP